MDIKVNDVLQIMSFKHNGYIHRIWDKAYVIDIDEEKVVVCTIKAKVHESTGRVWYTKEPGIIYFYFNKWYNTLAMLRNDGIYYYTNLSSPAVIENGKIKYIDYDVDLKTNRSKKYRVLDINEFYCHKYSMGYSKKIEEIVMKTLDEVINLFENEKEPFNDETVLKYYKQYTSVN